MFVYKLPWLNLYVSSPTSLLIMPARRRQKNMLRTCPFSDHAAEDVRGELLTARGRPDEDLPALARRQRALVRGRLLFHRLGLHHLVEPSLPHLAQDVIKRRLHWIHDCHVATPLNTLPTLATTTLGRSYEPTTFFTKNKNPSLMAKGNHAFCKLLL